MIAVENIVQYKQKLIETVDSAFLPQKAIISLLQNGLYCKPEVSVGDYVYEGQIIAKNIMQNAYIHASIPGKVVAFQKHPMLNGKKEDAVIIELEGEFTYLGKKREKAMWLTIPTSQRIKELYKAGVLNTFSKPQVLAAQIEKLQNKRSNCLALRLYNEDPSIITESFITQQYTEKVLEGAALVADSINAKSVYILYAQDLFIVPNDILVKKFFRYIDAHFVPVKTHQYPQGSFQNIQTNIERFISKELKKTYDKVSLAIDASTALDTYKAIVLNIPLIEKIIHVSGNSFSRDALLKVKIGTPIQAIIDELGDFVQKPAKIIINGIIKGRATANTEEPIRCDTKSITVLATKEFPDQTFSPCIQCGRCHQVCPANIKPELLFHHYCFNASFTNEIMESSQLCTECALCNMICPARLPLFQTISLLKEKI